MDIHIPEENLRMVSTADVPRTYVEPVAIEFDRDSPLLAYLDELVALGLHGDDRAEVCLTLVRRGLQDALSGKLLRIRRG